MNPHHTSRSSRACSWKYVFSVFIGCCSLGASSLLAQPSLTNANGIHIDIDWYTIAEPRYGASFDYDWNDIRVRSKDGAAIPNPIELEISRDEGGGLFYLTSSPITVPASGMIITFDSHVVMHPSDAERGTSLSDDPNAGCKRFQDGISRAVYHQVVSIVDAETGKTMGPSVSTHHFDVMRFQVLNDIDQTNNITIDLSAFPGKQVRIQTIVLAGYNGRGPSRSSTPVLKIKPAIQRDLK